MTKKADQLTFDFTGTDPQSGMINCTYSGMRGGIMRCFDIISEEGTLNNAAFPAGVYKASVASAWATANAVNECLSRMLDTVAHARETVMAVPCGTWDLGILAGVDDGMNPFVTMLLEPMAAGFGAMVNRDGVDTGGLLPVPMGRAPDAEINEFTTPVLYL